MTSLPPIGISLGDLNGIGPEVALKAAYRRGPAGRRVVLIGSAPACRDQAEALGLPPPPDFTPAPGARPRTRVSVWDPAPALRPRPATGRVTAAAARAAHAWIVAGTEACRNRSLAALVTAPISKEGFMKAGIDVPGHTELIAALTGTRRFAMMLFGGGLRVVLVTRHLPLKDVPAAVTPDAIREAIDITHEALPWLGCAHQRIAVCGLNPHAGDGGKLGDEEQTIIAPVIRAQRRRRRDVAGPFAADTVFHQAVQGHYDAVVAMYHDQGLGPLKTHAFDAGVNITLGLPIVRTSPDHGTGYDIAGRGVARPDSMIAALQAATELSPRPNPWARRP